MSPTRTTLVAAAAGLVSAALAVPAVGAALPSRTSSVSSTASVQSVGDSDNAYDNPRAPIIFGHRGAAGYRPEHTLASYDLAIRLGADVIEPDLVSTKDHQLVARHENNITGTTDVAQHPEFADRKATKVVDGVSATGWFTEDFTLAELKTLRALERLPGVRDENVIHNERYQIPTFQEVLDLALRESKEYRRPIGVAPETKHPTYFDGIGLSLEEPLVKTLRANHLDRGNSKVYVQSFETGNLRELRAKFHLKVHLVQLTDEADVQPYDAVANHTGLTYGQILTPAGLATVAQYADWLGPYKLSILPQDADGRSLPPTSLIPDAHAAGLEVVPYTVRAENQFLPLQDRSSADPNAYGNIFGELNDLFSAGVDGVFSDNADLVYAAREDFLGYTYGLKHPQAHAS